MSRPPCARSSASSRCGSGAGSPAGRANAAVWNGASASAVTTHGETVVAKFLPRNGPSGWYSQAWMSRADQSLSRQKPKICSAALPTGNGLAKLARRADVHAELELEIEIARGPVARRGLVRALALAARPLDRRAADADRRGAAVIGDRHVFVVRHQRIVRPKHAPGIAGVEDRSEEIGEVADVPPAACISACAIGVRCWRSLCVAMLGAEGARQRSRSADQACGPSDIR